MDLEIEIIPFSRFPTTVDSKNLNDMGIIRQNSFTILQRLNVRMMSTKFQNSQQFSQWLVGLTDGAGSFQLDRKNNGTKWDLTYQIVQKPTNAQLLYYIKSMVKCGQVCKGKNLHWSFRISSPNLLNKVIFPLFDRYPLLTGKHYHYLLVKEAYNIITSDVDLREKNRKLEEISKNYKSVVLESTKSPIWDNLDLDHLKLSEVEFMTPFWLSGFWEAKGVFSIVEKEKRYVHRLGLTDKFDKQILEAIRLIMGSKAKVKDRRPKEECFAWDSTSHSVCQFAVNYFDGKLLGRSSLRFAIWRKSLNKDLKTLLKAQKLLRDLSE